MGMLLTLYRFSPDDFSTLQSSEENATSFLYGESAIPTQQLDLDKSWDALNFLISNVNLHDIDMDNPPANTHPIFGAHDIHPEWDFGYGPPRYLTIDEAKAANTVLQSISTEDLISRVNFKQMTEEGVYPNVWDQEADSLKEFIAESYTNLCNFYQQAAEADMYVVHLIC